MNLFIKQTTKRSPKLVFKEFLGTPEEIIQSEKFHFFHQLPAGITRVCWHVDAVNL